MHNPAEHRRSFELARARSEQSHVNWEVTRSRIALARDFARIATELRRWALAPQIPARPT